jgi:hypothetical protein
MKLKQVIRTQAPLVLALALSFAVRECAAQTNAFTYQGRLSDASGPVNGQYDFTFQLFDAPSGGNQVNLTVTNANQTVSNGLFTVTLNFGAGAFLGSDRWLQIAVRTNGSNGAFVTLAPLQLLTPTPYSLYAPNAATAAIANNVAANSVTSMGIQNSTITASKIASGQVVKSINGLFDSVTLSAGTNVTVTPSGNGLQLSASDATRWSLTGNSGTTAGANFLGTRDNQPLELRVNAGRALRLEPSPTSPNLIGGYVGNLVSNGVVGAAIGGGGWSPFPNQVAGNFAFVGGGFGNLAAGDHATVAGGQQNTTRADGSTIGGGAGNFIGAFVSQGSATIGGGGGNTNDGYGATIGGGINNTVGSPSYANGYETVSGGEKNTASISDATVGGGKSNYAGGGASTVSGGQNNTANGSFSFIGGGSNNVTSGDFSAIGGGEMNTANVTHSTVAGGGYNQAGSGYSTVSGGGHNTASGGTSFVGGGANNSAAGDYSAIAGGQLNYSGYESFIGGGYYNSASGDWSFIGGGYENSASGSNAAVGGGQSNSASGSSATVGGGFSNTALGNSDAIGGGSWNSANGGVSTIAGGSQNEASGSGSTIGGGVNNIATNAEATIGGGVGNFVGGQFATIAGGGGNTNNGYYGTIGGGGLNFVGGSSALAAAYATVSGGEENTASGGASTVPGGQLNNASGNFSFAAGNQANAIHQGAFVWGDSTAANIYSTAANQFTVRASGGTRFFSNAGATTGVSLPPGGGSWSNLSDRDSKENFAPSDGRQILDRVAALPISLWNYRSQAPSVRHIGPVAQDFAAAFGVGEDEKHITTVDESGVALAAIQGLNQKLEEETKARAEEILELKQRIDRLEQLLSNRSR